jgi:ATP-dependent Zn protease
MEHCDRPWWKRPPVWLIAIAAVLLLVVAVIEQTDQRATAMLYSTFLDQLEAGNVASVSFKGTEITGRFKRPVENSPSSGTAQSDSFRTHVPDFGDPALIPELRKQHAVIDVTSPSAWIWLLGRVPWPMLIFVGVILIAGFIRLVRRGKGQSGPAGPAMPMHGMMGLVSGLFGKQPPAASPPTREGDEPKNH